MKELGQLDIAREFFKVLNVWEERGTKKGLDQSIELLKA